MLRIAIVDDEPLVLQMVRDLILQEERVQIVGEFTSPTEALKELPQLAPDLLFLDIEMPGLGGIELATELSNLLDNINIVFLTAYDQYAIEAFRLNALHYILKPAEAKDIRQAISRAWEQCRKINPDPQSKIYVQFLGGVNVLDHQGYALVKWPTAKTEELFALLMLERKKPLDKWLIIDKLWPEAKEGKVEQTLYSTVYRLKKTLAEAGIQGTIQNRLGQYQMELSNVSLDLDVFENLAQELSRKKSFDSSAEEELFLTYQGELCQGRDYSWCQLMRHDLTRRFEELVTGFIVACRDKDDRAGLKRLLHRRAKIIG